MNSREQEHAATLARLTEYYTEVDYRTRQRRAAIRVLHNYIDQCERIGKPPVIDMVRSGLRIVELYG